MEDQKSELTKEEIEIRNAFENKDRELLKCPHCGELLDEIIVTKLEYVVDSYRLTKYGLEYNQTIENQYYEDTPYYLYCGNCDSQLNNDFVDKLEERELIDL